MKKGTWTAVVAAATVAATIGLAAQEGTPSSTQGRSNAGSQDAVTVTGCVQRADQVPAGTSGSSAATTAPTGSSAAADGSQKFVLTNVMPAGAAASATAGTTGTSTRSGRQFAIVADDNQLLPHVGHQMEIIGTFQTSSPAPGMSGAPKLKVDSLRMISAVCAQ